MKPPDSFIKWLQAHPAVWEALQEEWKPRVRDLFSLSDDWYVLTAEEIGRVGVWAIRLGSVTARLDFFTRSELRSACRWLPTLGQLVRMLEAVAHYDGWNLTIIEARGDSGNSYGFIVRDGPEGSFAIGPTAEEPEIACTALWAKVKGVESD